jgi:hypothetical protein
LNFASETAARDAYDRWCKHTGTRRTDKGWEMFKVAYEAGVKEVCPEWFDLDPKKKDMLVKTMSFLRDVE